MKKELSAYQQYLGPALFQLSEDAVLIALLYSDFNEITLLLQ